MTQRQALPSGCEPGTVKLRRVNRTAAMLGEDREEIRSVAVQCTVCGLEDTVRYGTSSICPRCESGRLVMQTIGG